MAKAARLALLARDGFRVHLSCMQPNCPYGGRTHEAAELLARWGDMSLDELERRAVCPEELRRREVGPERRHRVFVEVSSAPDGWGGYTPLRGLAERARNKPLERTPNPSPPYF